MGGWQKTKFSDVEWAQIKRLIAKSNGQVKLADAFEPKLCANRCGPGVFRHKLLQTSSAHCKS